MERQMGSNERKNNNHVISSSPFAEVQQEDGRGRALVRQG